MTTTDTDMGAGAVNSQAVGTPAVGEGPIERVREVAGEDRHATILTTLERISAIVHDLHLDPQSLKQAPRELQLSLAGSSGFIVASFFEWWSGFARVRGIVSYSATGSGNAYSDWRGWFAVALMVAVGVVSGWQLAEGSTATLRKIAAICALSCVAVTLWFWAAFSAAAGFSDGLTLDLGASFGMYLGIGCAMTAAFGALQSVRHNDQP